jgi:hypothetical protein
MHRFGSAKRGAASRRHREAWRRQGIAPLSTAMALLSRAQRGVARQWQSEVVLSTAMAQHGKAQHGVGEAKLSAA